MSNLNIDKHILEAFIYEISQTIESLEQVIIITEKKGAFDDETINEIFRFMHTIKGSSAMMMFRSMSTLAHQLEDIFYVIREEDKVAYDFEDLIDLTLESIDYFKIELEKVMDFRTPDGEPSVLLTQIAEIKNNFNATHKSSQSAGISVSKKERKEPEDDLSSEWTLLAKNKMKENLSLMNEDQKSVGKQEANIQPKQSVISVNVDKLDKLMDLVGEIVIAEAMVTQNPEVTSLHIESFDKSSRQLHKITGELQDIVMAIRMVPLSSTFIKMHRIVRDMSKKLDKKVALVVSGEETEVDKNIIEKIADPLMHIIRNSLDHGIEREEERLEKGKELQGTITMEAKNSGSDVLIIIKDDGRGLNRKRLYDKAVLHGLINQIYEEMSDKELYHLILHPGFSTTDEITEYSGRGVGMDVVSQNIESIGGTVLVESVENEGTTIVLKLPLTLAIIEGMNIKVGTSRFTLPIISIKESFRTKRDHIFKDHQDQEMIMVRGLCYPIIRLHHLYHIEDAVTDFEEGILIMVEEDARACCIFADELLGQQQVVVKALPEYIRQYKNIKGLGGCTLLGDGRISLILDIGQLSLSKVSKKGNSVDDDVMKMLENMKQNDIKANQKFDSNQISLSDADFEKY